MKTNTILIIGILAIIMVFGAAIALAQNASENKKDTGNQECTLTDGAKDCSGMMGGNSPSDNTEAEYGNHCGDMGAGMGSMMRSKGSGMKSMM